MWHIPVFTSGLLARTAYGVWWQDLYARPTPTSSSTATITSTSGSRSSRRPAKPIRTASASSSSVQVGRPHSRSARPQANSQVRNAGTFGVLQLTLHLHSYSWKFIPIAGSTFTDSGTQATHS